MDNRTKFENLLPGPCIASTNSKAAHEKLQRRADAEIAENNPE